MTHSPNTLGTRWLGGLESDLDRLRTQKWAGRVDYSETQPLFDDVVNVPVLARNGLHHILIGNGQEAQTHAPRRLRILAFGNLVAIDMSAANQSEPQPIGSFLFHVSADNNAPIDGLSVNAPNHMLLLNLETGKGSFVRHNPGVDGLSEASSEVDFDTSTLKLSRPLNTTGDSRAFAALTLASEMVEYALITEQAKSTAA